MIHDENKGSWCVQTQARWIHRQATPQRCFYIECSTREERGVVIMKKKGAYSLVGAFGLLGNVFFTLPEPMAATLYLLAGICFLLLAWEMLFGAKGNF